MLRYCWCLVLLLVYCLSNGSAIAPGLKLRLSQYALNNATESLINRFHERVRNLSTDGSQRVIECGGVINAFFKWSNLQLHEFVPMNLSAVPENGSQTLRVSTSGGKLRVSVDFQYDLIVVPIPIILSGIGSVQLSSRNLSVNFGLKIGASSSGSPQPYLTDCSATIDLDYEIAHDWKSRLALNSIRFFYGGLDNFIRMKVCDGLSNEAKSLANGDIKLRYKHGHFVFDYGLVAPMETRTGELVLYMRGLVSWESEDDYKQVPPEMRLIKSQKMGTVMITNYVLNSFAFSAQTHRQMENFVISPYSSFLSEKDKQYFNMTCPSTVCAGEFIPDLSEHYRYQYMSFRVSALDPPYTTFSSGNSILYLFLTLFFDVQDSHSGEYIAKSVIVVNLQLTCDVKLSLSTSKSPQELIFSDPVINPPNITVVSKKYSDISDSEVTSVLQLGSAVGSVFLAKLLEENSIPLPLSPLQLVNSNLTVDDNVITVDTDFKLDFRFMTGNIL